MSKFNVARIFGFFCALFFLISLASVNAEETLTWESCVKEALENHPDLMSAKESVMQARADKDISQSAIFPRISTELSGKKARTAGADGVETYAYSVSGEQLIFDGFKTASNINASAQTLTAQEYSYLVASSDVRLNLKVAFSALLRAQELISLTEKIQKRRSENLDLVKIRYQAGREHKGAVMTAQADLSEAEFEVAQAKRNLVLAQQDIVTQLGRRDRGAVKVSGDFNIEESGGAKPDMEILADSTPFLQELAAKKEAARFNLKAAKAEVFPKVYLNSSLGRTRTDWPPQDDAWSAGVTVSLPLFEGGNRAAKIRKARSQLDQAQAIERSGYDGVIYTLEKTWKEFQDAKETVSVKKNFLDAGLERAKISNAQYSSGLTTFNDWIIIENNLVNAQKAYLDAQENLLVAEGYWVQAKGGVLEYVEK